VGNGSSSSSVLPPNLFDTPVTTSTPPPAGMGAPLGAHLSGPSLFPPTGGSGTLPLSSSGTAPPRGAAQGSVEAEWDAFVGFDDPRKVPFTPPPQINKSTVLRSPYVWCLSWAGAGQGGEPERHLEQAQEPLRPPAPQPLREGGCRCRYSLITSSNPPPNPLNSTVSAHMPHSCPPNQPTKHNAAAGGAQQKRPMATMTSAGRGRGSPMGGAAAPVSPKPAAGPTLTPLSPGMTPMGAVGMTPAYPGMVATPYGMPYGGAAMMHPGMVVRAHFRVCRALCRVVCVVRWDRYQPNRARAGVGGLCARRAGYGAHGLRRRCPRSRPIRLGPGARCLRPRLPRPTPRRSLLVLVQRPLPPLLVPPPQPPSSYTPASFPILLAAAFSFLSLSRSVVCRVLCSFPPLFAFGRRNRPASRLRSSPLLLSTAQFIGNDPKPGFSFLFCAASCNRLSEGKEKIVEREEQQRRILKRERERGRWTRLPSTMAGAAAGRGISWRN
jgi:hypothetical protein